MESKASRESREEQDSRGRETAAVLMAAEKLSPLVD